MLLNGTPFAFVIDLAALASRREYLKLDKWLTDKIREHGVRAWSLSVDTRMLDVKLWFKTRAFLLLGTFYPSVRDIPEEALSFHNGRSGPGQGSAQECTATPGDPGHHARLPAVLRWVSRWSTLPITFSLFALTALRINL